MIRIGVSKHEPVIIKTIVEDLSPQHIRLPTISRDKPEPTKNIKSNSLGIPLGRNGFYF